MFYVLDEHHNLIPAYDKEGVLAVLEEAISSGSLEGITADSAFITKLKCCVTGGTNRVAFVTQAKYNAMKKDGSLQSNCLYIITDDDTYDGLDTALSEVTEKVNNIVNDIVPVPSATKATKATTAETAETAEGAKLLKGCSVFDANTQASIGLYYVVVRSSGGSYYSAPLYVGATSSYFSYSAYIDGDVRVRYRTAEKLFEVVGTNASTYTIQSIYKVME